MFMRSTKDYDENEIHELLSRQFHMLNMHVNHSPIQVKHFHLSFDVLDCDNVIIVVARLQSVTIIDPINYTILVAILFSGDGEKFIRLMRDVWCTWMNGCW